MVKRFVTGLALFLVCASVPESNARTVIPLPVKAILAKTTDYEAFETKLFGIESVSSDTQGPADLDCANFFCLREGNARGANEGTAALKAVGPLRGNGPDVPEPAIMVLMVLSSGIIGGMLRERKRKTV